MVFFFRLKANIFSVSKHSLFCKDVNRMIKLGNSHNMQQLLKLATNFIIIVPILQWGYESQHKNGKSNQNSR